MGPRVKIEDVVLLMAVTAEIFPAVKLRLYNLLADETY